MGEHVVGGGKETSRTTITALLCVAFLLAACDSEDATAAAFDVDASQQGESDGTSTHEASADRDRRKDVNIDPDDADVTDERAGESDVEVDAAARLTPVDDWNPGDPDDYVNLALGASGSGDVRAVDWLDCRNVAPIIDDADYLVGCDIPVDGILVGGWLFDWDVAFSFDDLPEDDDSNPAALSSAVMLGGMAVLNNWVESWCKSELDRVYIVQVTPTQPLAFAWSRDADADRYDAASQVASWVDRAFTLNGIEHERDVEVRHC